MRVLETFTLDREVLVKTPTTILLGQQLAMLRQTKGWNQDKAAVEAKLNVRTLKDLELGNANPNLGTLIQIATAYGVTLAAIFEPWRSGNAGAEQHILCKKLEAILKHPDKGPSIRSVINSMARGL